jgi:cell division protein ZapE
MSALHHPEETDSISAAGPVARYRAAVRAGDMQEDPLQLDVLRQLETLAHDLAGYQPPGAPPPRWMGWLKREKARRPAPVGLYIHGSVGRGKSMCMDLFFAAAPVERRRRVHFHAFMAEIHDRLHALRGGKTTPDDLLAAVAAEVAERSWLLCFDEFVVNNIVDAMLLGRLFQALFDKGVVIVATSNFAPDDLYKDGLQRDRFEPFIAILKSRMTVLTLDGPNDYRRLRRAGQPVFYAPLGAAATAALTQAFADLTDDADGAADEVEVYGRKVPIRRAAKGVACFTFADLCAQPLGASDYLALARRYHTLILDQVPVLSADNHNEARRFITLIDALYEARTKLLMAAAAPPDALYPQGTGAFEFQRTASRLMEMQSADYAALPSLASAGRDRYELVE